MTTKAKPAGTTKRVQVGTIAYRSKDDPYNITHVEPIFEDDSPEIQEAKERMFGNLAKLFAEKMREDVEAGRFVRAEG